MTDPKLCVECGERPRSFKYLLCGRCRHAKEKVPCPSCAQPMAKKSRLCRACANKTYRGPAHGCWKGGRILDGDGYVRVWMPEHPRANMKRYVKEHHVVMEQHLGRYLLPGENVHHMNGVTTDNRLENLELWYTGQPPGQRVSDLVEWAHVILDRYGQQK